MGWGMGMSDGKAKSAGQVRSLTRALTLLRHLAEIVGVIKRLSVAFWHKDDLRLAAPEGLLTNGLRTFGAECLVSGGKPTVF